MVLQMKIVRKLNVYTLTIGSSLEQAIHDFNFVNVSLLTGVLILPGKCMILGNVYLLTGV